MYLGVICTNVKQMYQSINQSLSLPPPSLACSLVRSLARSLARSHSRSRSQGNPLFRKDETEHGLSDPKTNETPNMNII